MIGQMEVDTDLIAKTPEKAQSENGDSFAGNTVGLRRIIIQDMILENFKSYAGIQRIGPFHKSFSSIVGPNGSGKSNVIDAMLFVFGKRAKQLRLNKISELIHNSENHKFEFAKVSVQFVEIIDKDNEESEIVPESCLTISRVAYLNNESKYFINERASTFSEVTDLLKKKGIDLDHNRFLILQGEVEQISLMKPKAQSAHEEGLLEYLEDIIGSNKYIERIEMESDNLEKVNDRRCSVVHRFKIVEKERQSIEAGRNEAIEYLKTENEILNNESILIQVEDFLLEKEVSGLESRLEESIEKLNEEKGKTQTFKAEIDQLEKVFSVCSAEQKEIEKDMKSAKQSFEEFERRDVKVREELKQAKIKQKKLGDKISRESSKKMESVKNLKELSDQVSSAARNIGECEERLRGEEGKLAKMQDSIKDELSVFRERMEGLKKELEPFETQLNNLAAENAEITDEKQELTKGKTSISDSLNKEKIEYDTMLKNLDDVNEKLDSRKKQSQELKGQISKSKLDLKTLQKEADIIAEQAGKALGLLEEKKSSAKATAERSGVHSALMEAKRSGKIAGIIGRLGDLGTIDAKYDVAISTACNALNWIVVETTKAAQECVDFLRREKLGVSTFLILEKQNHLVHKMKEDVSTPESVPRLFDLVKASDQRYLPAFFFALGNTTVAATLEQASRIAFGSDQRFKRIVTVDGQLIESSGTMSGGGNKKARGGMRANFKDDDCEGESIRKAEQSFSEIHRRKEEMQRESLQLEEKIGKAESEYQALNEEIPRLELERKNLQISLKRAKKSIAALTEQEKNNEKHVAQLASLNDRLNANIEETEKVKHSMNPCLQRYEEAKMEMDKVGGPEMARQRALVQDLKAKVLDENSNLNKMKIDISKLQKSDEKCQKEIENCKSQIETLKKEISRLEEELSSMEEKAANVLDSFTDLQNTYERKTSELEGVREKFEERKKYLASVRKVELETKAHIDELKKTIEKHQTASTELKGSVSLKESKQLENFREMVDDDNTENAESMLQNRLSADELENISKAEIEKMNEELRVTLGMMKPDMNAIRAFKDKNTDYMQALRELEAITKERDTIRKEYDALRKKRLEDFMTGFNSISLKLKEMYQMITLGGDAELELVDSLDPFTEGIVFSVRPPRKSWKNISNLSGGEKTLSSLALVFALHHYKPTPLYVMDEIDAALDFKNVSIVAHYIKERTRDAQFVIISLRNQMFELADRLVGIYKTNNATKSVTINPRQFGVPVEA